MAEAAIDALNVLLSKAFEEQDIDTLVNSYTEDCQLLYTGKPIVIGREDYRKVCIEEFFNAGVKKVEIKRLSFIDAGDYAIETANWKALGEGDKIISDGKYTGVFRKDSDGKWRVHIDCSNSNVSE